MNDGNPSRVEARKLRASTETMLDPSQRSRVLMIAASLGERANQGDTERLKAGKTTTRGQRLVRHLSTCCFGRQKDFVEGRHGRLPDAGRGARKFEEAARRCLTRRAVESGQARMIAGCGAGCARVPHRWPTFGRRRLVEVGPVPRAPACRQGTVGMARDYRIFIYADGVVPRIVVPLNCEPAEIRTRLRAILAHDIVATRAEVRAGRRTMMTTGMAGIEALLAFIKSEPLVKTLH
jgi:hypothetical protein